MKKLMRKLVFFFHIVCHSHVHDGQYHEYKCLQRDHKDVEYGPTPLQEAPEDTDQQAGTEHGGNQDEDHLTRIHVAEQPQAKRDRLGDQCDGLEGEVNHDQQRRKDDTDAVERRVERVES